jgi:hypothetical protein
MIGIINIVASYHLLEIVNEFSLLNTTLYLLIFAHQESWSIDSLAKSYFLLYNGVNSAHRSIDIIILDFDINLEHVESSIEPLKFLRCFWSEELTINHNADFITDFLCFVNFVSDQ